MGSRIQSVELPHVDGVSHRHVQVAGLSVHVAEVGRGAPLVLLHGWPQHWYCWRRLIPLLPGRRLIMPDLRGHGWTDAPHGGYEKEQLATDLLDLLDALAPEPVGLIAHDWGAWTGFLACLRRPERFTGLLALGIVPPFQRPTVDKALQVWRGAYQLALAAPVVAEAALRSSPRFVASGIAAATVRNDATSASDRLAYGRVIQQAERAKATVRLYRTFLLRELPLLGRYQDQRLSVPTRLLIGDGDPIGSPALLDGWQAHADDMTVAVLAGAGHFLPEETPREVAEAARSLFSLSASS